MLQESSSKPASDVPVDNVLTFLDIAPSHLKEVRTYKFFDFFNGMPEEIKYFSMPVEKSQLLTFFSDSVAKTSEFVRSKKFSGDNTHQILAQATVMLLESPCLRIDPSRPRKWQNFHAFITLNDGSKPINTSFVVTLDLDATHDHNVGALEFRLTE